MSKSPTQHPVRLQKKLNVTEKNEIQIHKFLQYFAISHSTSHRPIAVADLGERANDVKPFITSCL